MAKVKEEKNVAVVEEAGLPDLFQDDIELYVAQNDVRDIESDEVITPRIALLQSMSRQVKKSLPEYIPGAEEGMIYNTGTKKVYSGEKGLIFVPCYTERTFNEWTPIDAGGGLVRRWGSDQSFKNDPLYAEEKGKWQQLETDEKGKQTVKTEIIKTADYYVLVVDEETGVFAPAVIGFSGTKYKVHRKLINDISIADYVKKDGSCVTPPPFHRVYRLTTVPEANDGNSWFTYRWERLGDIRVLRNADKIWEAAKQFRELVTSGSIKVAEESPEVAPTYDAETI